MARPVLWVLINLRPVAISAFSAHQVTTVARQEFPISLLFSATLVTIASKVPKLVRQLDSVILKETYVQWDTTVNQAQALKYHALLDLLVPQQQ